MTMTLLVIFGAIWFWSVLASACLTSPVYGTYVEDKRKEARDNKATLDLEAYEEGVEQYHYYKPVYGTMELQTIRV